MSHNQKEYILSKIQEVYEECKERNWDGYDAKAITQETCAKAIEFLKALPTGFCTPSEDLEIDVVPEPDGSIAFERYKKTDNQISVSISANGNLQFCINPILLCVFVVLVFG